jgi:hypothetical protein
MLYCERSLLYLCTRVLATNQVECTLINTEMNILILIVLRK